MSTATDKDIEQKRAAVAKAYRGTAWVEKVQRMGPDQIVAVYLRLQKQNKL